MYELCIKYTENGEDTILCTSKPRIKVKGYFLVINCGDGQTVTVSIDTFISAKIKAPIPDKLPAYRYSADIHYHTDTENVELLYTSAKYKVKILPYFITVLYDGNVPVRIINGDYLRNIKINTCSFDD